MTISLLLHACLLAAFAAVALETAVEADRGVTEVAVEPADSLLDGRLDTTLNDFAAAPPVRGIPTPSVEFDPDPDIDLTTLEDFAPEFTLSASDVADAVEAFDRPADTSAAIGPAGIGRFFGLEKAGSEFVYVVDSSQSMQGRRFARAIAELRRSIGELSPRQRFYVFFFSDRAYPMFGGRSRGPVPATAANKRNLYRWLGTVGHVGKTDPTGAVLAGLRFEPDALFLLTDGMFGRHIVSKIAAENRRDRSVVPILTVGFENRDGEPLLQHIAAENAGTYRFVP
ncbi:MAG: hypothetical protein AAF532_10020 [Planctomycetota bacterium]